MSIIDKIVNLIAGSNENYESEAHEEELSNTAVHLMNDMNERIDYLQYVTC